MPLPAITNHNNIKLYFTPRSKFEMNSGIHVEDSGSAPMARRVGANQIELLKENLNVTRFNGGRGRPNIFAQRRAYWSLSGKWHMRGWANDDVFTRNLPDRLTG